MCVKKKLTLIFKTVKKKQDFLIQKVCCDHLLIAASSDAFLLNLLANTAESDGLDGSVPSHTGCIHSPLCHSQISLFNIQADLQIAFLYESLSARSRPLHTFIRAKNSFANEAAAGEQPCPTERQDAFPLFTQHGSGGMVGAAWPCSSRSTQSRSCLIQGLSASMFLRSQTSDNTKLP